MIYADRDDEPDPPVASLAETVTWWIRAIREGGILATTNDGGFTYHHSNLAWSRPAGCPPGLI